ncbi:MAG: hypothetical protein QOI78_8703, partial [Actinomycetota bacterium]|nr:hypothetical protein [Actinomycetota bacterium]
MDTTVAARGGGGRAPRRRAAAAGERTVWGATEEVLAWIGSL